jgi:cell fate (sporulation/competence/biofilm development) regulator YlbF (YheA/YmcA/DUF963 family)
MASDAALYEHAEQLARASRVFEEHTAALRANTAAIQEKVESDKRLAEALDTHGQIMAQMIRPLEEHGFSVRRLAAAQGY